MESVKIISVIIICTRDEQYLEAKSWIEKQSVASQIEIIALDNKGNKNFASAAKALNVGAQKAIGKYLIFMHQDVYLWDNHLVERCINYLDKHSNHIVGVAGIRKSDNRKCFDIYMSKDRKQYAYRTENQFVPAITLDECFLAMNKNLWKSQPFDEETCDNWHFYGADICYVNLLNGGTNVVMPAEILHDSFGNPYGKAFQNGAKKLVDKYKGKFDYIYTTCISAKCSKAGVKRFFIKRRFILIVKGMFKTLGLSSLFEFLNNKRKKKRGDFIEK